MTRITVTTANICCNPVRPLKKVHARTQRAASQGGVVFGQEIQIPSYDDVWNHEMHRRGKNTYGQNTEVPVSLPQAVWTHAAADTILVHHGKRKVTPSRYITRVRAKRVTKEEVTFLNCHTVSKQRLWAPSGALRLEFAAKYWDELTSVVAEEWKLGRTVVFGGDLNNRKPPEFHPQQIVLHHSGYDWLYVVPAPLYKVSNIRRTSIARTITMDHPILTGSFDLTRKAHR